jgi:heme A synthase
VSDAPPPLQAPPSVRSAVALIAAIAGLITAIAGLVTAIAALRKQPEEPAARASYVVVQEVDKARGRIGL